jgi:hypothetical protein
MKHSLDSLGRRAKHADDSSAISREHFLKNYVALFMFSTLAISAISARADQVTVLGTASTYAVLGGTAVNNTGATVITGNLGLAANTSAIGFPPGSVTGSFNDANGAATTAKTDATTAYNSLSALTPTQLLGSNLDSLTLTSGVYSFTSDAVLDIGSELTLDFAGSANANIIFLIPGQFTTGFASSIDVINLGFDDNVYFVVGGSATLGSDSQFMGDIIANADITANDSASVSCGSLLALGTISMTSNTLTNCSATGSDVSNTVFAPPPPPSPVPEPGSLALLATGLVGAAGTFRRKLLA